MAAEDLKTKKRKGAQEAAPKPKKQKKTADPKPARKQADDFFSDNEAPAAEPVKKKSSKKNKAAADVNGDKPIEVQTDAPLTEEKPKKKGKKSKKDGDAEVAAVAIVAGEEAPTKKSKKSKSSKKQKGEPEETITEVVAGAEDAEDGEEDDQTAALLAGFESDRDESDLEKEDEGLDDAALEKATPKLSKKQRLALEKAAKREEPGVVYVGRIPHGFFEPQMKRYFNQFGTVLRLRLSRNKKTGASKHYAFVEFASGEVADIVAETMNNYLLFGHILQCKVVPTEQVHPDLFKGANKRFKVDPRNKKAGLEMSRGAERNVWEKRVANENKRRAAKNKQLKEEFDYEYTAPSLKAVDDVPKNALENGVSEQQLLIEAPTKKGQKGAKAKIEQAIEPTEATEEVKATPEKKTKTKKRKSDVTSEVEAQVEPVAETSTRSKRAKKEVKPDASEEVKDVKRKAKSEEGAKPKRAKKAKA